MKLSIIIPVYNVEKYIEKCLFSCLNQDIPFDDYEIIVVNDGSPDNSLSIVERVADKYGNIRVVSQTNSGLSMARNKGLSLANGEYVWFVDSDDYIEENCLNRIIKQLNGNLDILQLQYRLVYEDGSPSQEVPQYYIDGIQNGYNILMQGGLPHPAQFSIYRAEFLRKHHLEFVQNIYHEDSEFKPRATFFAQSIAADTEVCYNYLQRLSGSITSVVNPKRSFDCIKVALSIDVFFNKIAKKQCSIFFHNHISLMINNGLANIVSVSAQGTNMNEIVTRFNDELHECRYLFKHLRNSSIWKYKLEGWLFTLFSCHTILIYKWMQKFNRKQ